MSTTIDQKVVEMQFDNSRFEGNVQTSLSTIDKLKNALRFDSSSKGLEEIGNQASRLNFNPMSEGLETVKLKFSALEAVGLSVLMNLTNKAVDAGISFAKSLSVDNVAAGWKKFGDKTTSVATLVSQGYELEEVNEQLERLNWFSDETSYNFTDMVSNIAKFTATGEDLTTSVNAMQGIATWAALSGQNAATASRAMYQLSQAMGKGALKYDDFKSIQNASMDTVEFRQKALEAAEALGKVRKEGEDTYRVLSANKTFTMAEMFSSDALSRTMWFSKDVMMDTFKQYSAAVDQLYDYSSEHDVTASQAIQDLGDEVDAFGLKAFKAAQEARTWGDVVDSVKDAVSTGWMTTFELIFGKYDEAVELWTDLANRLYDVFTASSYARNEILQTWNELGGREHLINSLHNVFDGLAGVLDLVKGAFEKVIPDITGEKLYDLTGKVEAATEKFKNFFSIFSKEEEGTEEVTDEIEEQVESVNNLRGAYWNIFDTVEDVQERELAWAKQRARATKDERELKKAYEDTGEFVEDLQAHEAELNKQRYISAKTLQTEVRTIAEINGELDASVQNTAESMEEDLGSVTAAEKLLNVFNGLSSSVSILQKVMEAFWTGISPTIENAKALLGDVSEIVFDFLSDVGLALTSWDEGADATSGPFRKITTTVHQVMMPINALISKTRAGIVWFTETWSELTVLLGSGDYEGVNHLTESLGNLFEKLTGLGSTIFSSLTTGVANFIKAFDFNRSAPDAEDFAGSIDWLSERLANFVDHVTPIADILTLAFSRIKEAFDWFGEVLGSLGTILKSGEFEGIERLSNYIGGLWDQLEGTGTGLFDDLIQGIKSFLENFQFDDPLDTASKMAETLDTIAGGFARFYEVIQPAVDFIFTAVDKLREGVDWFKTTWSEFWDTINNSEELSGFSKLAETLKGYWDDAVNGVSQIFSTLFGRSSKLLGGLDFEEDLPTGEKIAKFLDGIAGKLADFLKVISPIISVIGFVFDFFISALNGVFDAVSKIFGDFKNVDTSGLTNVTSDVEEKVRPFATFLDGVGKLLGGIWSVIKYIAPVIGTLLGDIGTEIGKFAGKAGGFLKEHATLENLITIIAGIFTGKTVIKGVGLFKNFFDTLEDGTSVFSGVKGILDSFKDFVDGLSESLEAFKNKIKMDNVVKIASAIGILVLSLKILSTIEAEKAGFGIFVMGVLMKALMKVADDMTEAANKLSISGPWMKQAIGELVKFLLAFSIAVLLLSSAVKKLGNLEWGELVRGLVGVGILMLFVDRLLKVTDKLENGNLVKGMGGLIAVAISVRILAGAVKKLGDMAWGELIKGLVGVGALFVAMGVLMKVMDTFKYDSLSKGMVGLIAFAIAIRLLVKPLKELGTIPWAQLGEGYVGLLALFSVIGLFSVVVDAMGEQAGKLVAAGIGILIFSAAIKVMAGVMAEIGQFGDEQFNKGIGGLYAMAGVIAIFAGITHLMEGQVGSMVAAATGVLILSAALVVLGLAMSNLGEMSPEEIGTALLAIGAAMLIFAQGAQWLQGSIATLIGFSAALILLGVALAVLMVPLLMLNSIIESGNIEVLIMSFAAILVTLVALVVILNAFSGAILGGVVVMLALSAAIAVLGAGLALLAGALMIFATIGVPGALAFAAAIIIIAGAIATAIPMLVAGIVTGIVVFVALLAQYAPVILKSIIDILYWMVRGIITALPRILQGLVDGIIDLVLGLVQWFVDTWGKIKSFIGNLFSGGGKDLGEQLATGLKGGMDGKQEEVVDAGGDMGENILNTFKNSLNKDGGVGGAVEDGMEGGLLAFDKYELAFPNVTDQIAASSMSSFRAGFDPSSIIDQENGEALESLSVFGVDASKYAGENGEGINSAYEAFLRGEGSMSDTTSEELGEVEEEMKSSGGRSAEEAHKMAKQIKKNYYDEMTDQNGKEHSMKDATGRAWGNVLEETLQGGDDVAEASADAGEKASKEFIEKYKKTEEDTNTIAGRIKEKLTTTQSEVQRIGEDTGRVYYAGAFTDDETQRVVGDASAMLADKGAQGITDEKDEFVAAGENVVYGYTDGIYGKWSNAYAAGAYIARQTLHAMQKTLDEHSPSKETMQIGIYAVDGLVNALYKFAGRAYDAGAEVGGQALDGVADAIRNMSDSINDDIDPVIRPVLDLSDITKGTATIDDILNGNRSMRLAGNAALDRASISTLQNGVENELLSSMKKLTAAISGGGNTINVYAQPGMDVRQLADEVQKRLTQLENQRRAVFA